ncbi:MAG: hypothetical protein KIS87_02165 [Phycisphaeraceae bacterium]|nr:hypothetical protein [Phycisphaeraceae bacterium]
MNCRLATAVAAYGVISALAFAAWARPGPETNTRDIESLAALKAARRAYSRVDMTPFADAVPTLSARSFEIELPEDCANDFALAQAHLFDTVNEFVRLRLANPAPAQYVRWRRNQGYAFRTIDDMKRSWFIHTDWEFHYSEPFPDEAPVERVFARFFTDAFTLKDGYNKPVAIARVPEGLICTVARVESLHGAHRPVPNGTLGRNAWAGATNGTLRNWWRHERNGEALLKEHGSVLCAEVGILLQFEDGSRRPLVLTLVLDPRDNEWRIEFLNTYNCDLMRTMAFEF